MNNILQEMLNKYNCITKEDYVNAFKEIVQEVALYSLSLTDFFDYAAFYGGTALRIFYNLNRFSEDLDFSLCIKQNNFDITRYFDSLTKTFESLGLNFIPMIKEKTFESNIQSAFLKGNTLEHILLIAPKGDISNHIQKSETIKIKFEIDINPPSCASYEYKYSSVSLPYKIKIYDESSLFAGKVHAVLCRNWKKRVKGRDLYDFEFYIRKRCLLNIKHLEQRMIQTGHWTEKETLTLEKVKQLLKDKFKEINFTQAKTDVLPFINNSSKLNNWNNEYFSFLTNHLKDNIITIKKTTYDISNPGNANIIEETFIKEFNCPSNEYKNNLYNEIKIKFNKFIIADDDILNFGNKKELTETCFNIIGFNEILYLKHNIDIQKLFAVFNKINND